MVLAGHGVADQSSRRTHRPLYTSAMAALPTRREALKTSLLALGAHNISTSISGDRWTLEHVNVIDGSGSLLSDQTVLVDGDRIAAVDQSAVPRALASAKRIDATGKYLMPGLWDMHVHLSYTKQSALPIMLANGITRVFVTVVACCDSRSCLEHSVVCNGKIPALSRESVELHQGLTPERGARLSGKFANHTTTGPWRSLINSTLSRHRLLIRRDK